MQDSMDNETYFITMKKALKDQSIKLDTDNSINQDMFEPDQKLNAMLNDFETLENLSLSNNGSYAPMTTPVFIKDIDIQITNIRGSITLPKGQLLLTDFNHDVKLIDTKHDIIVSELKLPDYLWDVTRIKDDEVAITCFNAKKIHFVTILSNELLKGREMLVGGVCRGIEYNNLDDTLIVTYYTPPKVEILSLNGTVTKKFDNNANGVQLFRFPTYVALCQDKTMIYVTEDNQSSVILMTLTGDVKVVYNDDRLQGPRGVCVSRSGIVYVVGYGSNTVHQIVPGSDKFELLLDQKDGLKDPFTITYCDTEDKLYVGQNYSNKLKVFKLR